jgi:hypothetical protein
MMDHGSNYDCVSLAAHIALQRFEPYLSSKPLAQKSRWSYNQMIE